MASTRMYIEKDPTSWRVMTRNYWVGRTPDMKVVLEWIEGFKDVEITDERIEQAKSGCELMTDLNPVDASQQMWSYLNLNLQGDVVETFRNVGLLNGAEAWRRIIQPIDSNSAPKRSSKSSGTGRGTRSRRGS